MPVERSLSQRLLAAKDYRVFLRQVVAQEGLERGYRKRLADHAGCQAAYLSQVLKGNVELTPEQAERLCVFWEFDECLSEIFLTLVLHGRAGTPSLRQRLALRLEKLREEWRSREKTFQKPELSAGDRALIYYSDWRHSAIHMLLTVASLRTPAALAAHLHLQEAEVKAILEDLAKIDVVVKENGLWRVKQMQIHAPVGAATAAVHHRNWRTKALALPESRNRVPLRYTSVHSLSAEDFKRVREILDRAIRDTRQVIEPSAEETVACLLVDYFEVR